MCELKYEKHLLYHQYQVTPSRVCELKLLWCHSKPFVLRSHPHGCVSWNRQRWTTAKKMFRSHPHGCVSWNFYSVKREWTVIPSHPHGCVSWNNNYLRFVKPTGVTPSRVCELKWTTRRCGRKQNCHTLTGVWVEIKHQLINYNENEVTPSRVCELKCSTCKGHTGH